MGPITFMRSSLVMSLDESRRNAGSEGGPSSKGAAILAALAAMFAVEIRALKNGQGVRTKEMKLMTAQAEVRKVKKSVTESRAEP